MSKRAREFLQRQNVARQAKRRRPKHPQGREPGVDLDASTGCGVAVVTVPASAPMDPVDGARDPRWDGLLSHFGFGGQLEVLELLDVRSWEVFSQRAHGEACPGISEGHALGDYCPGLRQLHYVRAKVRRRDAARARLDVEALCEEVRNHAPRPELPAGTGARVLCFSDWQLGKRDGDGVKGTVERILRSIDRVAELLQADPVEELYLFGMGDLIEACEGHYPMQQFSVELNRRDQVRVARRLVLHAVKTLAPLAPRLVLAFIPGNHGENRRNGKAFTDWADNDDVAIAEQVAEILAESPEAYGHVEVRLPGNELTLTLKVQGMIVGLAHGHQVRSQSGDAILKWWQRAAYARRLAIGDADLLLTAHYHSLRVADDGSRSWIQCPTVEGASQWWEEAGGCSSRKGQLTFRITGKEWHGLEVV